MSSRTGNVITGESLIADVSRDVREKMSERRITKEMSTLGVDILVEKIAVGAIKYSILKQAIGKDIIFDFEKSISFEGDSGPYLQYTYARTQSVLATAKTSNLNPSTTTVATWSLQERGSRLLRWLERFPEVVKRALAEYAPQLVATYLIELASAFNAHYAQNQIINLEDKKISEYRLALTQSVGTVLKNGLWLLGIKAPERM